MEKKSRGVTASNPSPSRGKCITPLRERKGGTRTYSEQQQPEPSLELTTELKRRGCGTIQLLRVVRK